MRTPNLNCLKMFDAAARHLNFRLAAEELNLTQGAVAQQVRRLEADLGVRLFHRKARGLALTDIGRGYHTPVRRALAMLDEATDKLRPQVTRVRLSITPSLASKWLVPRLGAFARANPGIEVQTIASEGLSDFRYDGVDLAIRQGRPPFGKDLQATLLAPLDLRAVCSPSYAEMVGPIAGFADFAGLKLIQDGHYHWTMLFEEAGLKVPQPMMQLNQTALAMDAAANGQGVTLAPRLLLDADLEQRRLVELWRDTRADQSGYYIVHPDAARSNEAVRTVVDWILSEVGTI